MIIVDYQSKSYQRFLEDVPGFVQHPKRFLITLNGPSAEQLAAVQSDLEEFSDRVVASSTAVGDNSEEQVINELFVSAFKSKDILRLDNADIVFTQTVHLKKSYQQDRAFNLNNLLKNIAKHKGMTVLATAKPQVVSSSMSSRLDVLVRFPNAE